MYVLYPTNMALITPTHLIFLQFSYKMSVFCVVDPPQHFEQSPGLSVCVQVLDQREPVHYSTHHPSVRVHGSEPRLSLQHPAGPAHQTEGRAARRVLPPFQHPAAGSFASKFINSEALILSLHYIYFFLLLKIIVDEVLEA